MNWNNYKNWLETNIFNADGSLKEEVIHKYLGFSYSEEQEKELGETINNLMLSLDATFYNNEEFHQLPDYNGDTNWEGQISSDIKLGKNNLLNTSKISPKVYNILARMFNEWQQTHEEEIVDEEEEETDNPKQEESNWLTNLPWGKISLIGGGIIVIIFAIAWLKSKFK